MKLPLTVALLLLFAVANASAFTKHGASYTTDGSLADVQAAINNATAATNTTPGDTVNVPAGTFTWGTNGSCVSVSKAITLSGAGTDKTFISVAASGAAYNGVCRIYNAGRATVQNMTFNSPSSGSSSAAALATGGTNDWRITNVNYNFNGSGGYFAYCASYGLIDNCTVNNPSAQTLEIIFIRGPVNSWQIPNSMGTKDAVYIEDCTFGPVGYVCDANSNARVVVRNCTISGAIKIDAHGKASNTPPRSCRQIEAYNNHWTAVGIGGAWPAMELRGGTGMVFNNKNDDNTNPIRGFLRLNEYSAFALWPNFGKQYQTPANYPIDDQIGVGEDPKAGGSEPMYVWDNTKAGGTMPMLWSGIPAAAITQYQSQTGHAAVPFSFQLTATGNPTSWVSSGNPDHVLTTASSGLLSGTVYAPVGEYTATQSATNASGSGSATFKFLVSEVATPLPIITSAVNAVVLIKQPFSYQVTATNSPTGFAATGLPAGLSIDTGTGIISGSTAAAAAKVSVTVSATNAAGTFSAKVLLIVTATTPAYPVFTSAASANAISGSTFTMQDIIKADRDYFVRGTSFDGSSGVGEGTHAQMNAITPTKTGVGFWVTDEGTWNNGGSGSGQLYVWTGSTWKLTYTPFTYPHPLRSGSYKSIPTSSTLPAPTNLRVIN